MTPFFDLPEESLGLTALRWFGMSLGTLLMIYGLFPCRAKRRSTTAISYGGGLGSRNAKQAESPGRPPSYRDDVRMRLALRRIIDKRRFEELQKSDDAGAEIPIKGIPLKAYKDYDSYRKAVTSEFELYKFEYDYTRSSAYARTYLSSAAGERWIECKRLESRDRTGVHMWPTEVSKSSAAVVFVRGIGHKAAGGRMQPQSVYRRQAVLCREICDPGSLTQEHRVHGGA